MDSKNKKSVASLFALTAIVLVLNGCSKDEPNKAEAKKAASQKQQPNVQDDLIAQSGFFETQDKKLTAEDIQAVMSVGFLEAKSDAPNTVNFVENYNSFGSLSTNLSKGYGLGEKNHIVRLRDAKGDLSVSADVTALMVEALVGQPVSSIALLKHAYLYIHNDSGEQGRLHAFHPDQGKRSHQLILHFLADLVFPALKKSHDGSLELVTTLEVEAAIDEWMVDDYDAVAIEDPSTEPQVDEAQVRQFVFSNGKIWKTVEAKTEFNSIEKAVTTGVVFSHTASRAFVGVGLKEKDSQQKEMGEQLVALLKNQSKSDFDRIGLIYGMTLVKLSGNQFEKLYPKNGSASKDALLQAARAFLNILKTEKLLSKTDREIEAVIDSFDAATLGTQDFYAEPVDPKVEAKKAEVKDVQVRADAANAYVFSNRKIWEGQVSKRLTEFPLVADAAKVITRRFQARELSGLGLDESDSEQLVVGNKIVNLIRIDNVSLKDVSTAYKDVLADLVINQNRQFSALFTAGTTVEGINGSDKIYLTEAAQQLLKKLEASRGL